jgi:DNA-directed RNA polymerase specialized sigma subunit
MIQNKLSEIYQLKTMACSITVSNDGERVQTSPDKDRLGTTVAKIVDLENETNKLIDSFIAERSHIISQIDKINDTNMYTVLTARYVSGKTIEDIAKDMSYSRMQVDRIRNNALSEFEKMYGNEYLDKK